MSQTTCSRSPRAFAMPLAMAHMSCSVVAGTRFRRVPDFRARSLQLLCKEASSSISLVNTTGASQEKLTLRVLLEVEGRRLRRHPLSAEHCVDGRAMSLKARSSVTLPCHGTRDCHSGTDGQDGISSAPVGINCRPASSPDHSFPWAAATASSAAFARMASRLRADLERLLALPPPLSCA